MIATNQESVGRGRNGFHALVRFIRMARLVVLILTAAPNSDVR